MKAHPNEAFFKFTCSEPSPVKNQNYDFFFNFCFCLAFDRYGCLRYLAFTQENKKQSGKNYIVRIEGKYSFF